MTKLPRDGSKSYQPWSRASEPSPVAIPAAAAGARRWSGRASAGAHRWSGRTTAGAADLGDLGGLCSIWGIWATAVGWLTGRPTRSALELVGLGSPRVRG